MKETLEQHEVSSILQALKEAKLEHIKRFHTLSDLSEQGGNNFITEQGARDMAKRQYQTIVEFQAVIEKIEKCQGVWTLIE